jgi:hypothetical protein
MIDFKNASFVKLREVPGDEGHKMVGDLLIEDEQILTHLRVCGIWLSSPIEELLR